MRGARQYAHVVLKAGHAETDFARGVEKEFYRLLAEANGISEAQARREASLACTVEVPDGDVFRDFDFSATAPEGCRGLNRALWDAFEQPLVWCCDSFEGPQRPGGQD